MISSIVLTFKPGIQQSKLLRQQWASNPAFEIGDLIGLRLPMTIEAESADEMESHTRQLLAFPDVLNVDVVYVDLTNECES